MITSQHRQHSTHCIYVCNSMSIWDLLPKFQRCATTSGSTTASQPHRGTLCTGYRSGNVYWSLSCRCWCLIVCTTGHPAICLPCANRSLITLVVVTYARQHVVILQFQPQGRFDTVLAASLWQERTVHLELSSSTDTQLSSDIRVPS